MRPKSLSPKSEEEERLLVTLTALQKKRKGLNEISWGKEVAKTVWQKS